MAASTQTKQLDELYGLIAQIKTAMLTTRRQDGRLVSRPMATQKRDPIADLWFVADIESLKMDELEHDPHVNVAYLDSRSWEWVSVSGTATIATDPGEIRRLYEPDWKAWFGAIDETRNGGPDDPRLALILVDADSVVYMKQEKSKPVVLFEVAKALVTGSRPDVGEPKRIEPLPKQRRSA
jgi:general stress protein 26